MFPAVSLGLLRAAGKGSADDRAGEPQPAPALRGSEAR